MNSPIRGIRNNNPFNIKHSKCPWFGELTYVKKIEPTFCRFKLMEYGVRAGLLLLLNYVRKGFDTPRKVIERFAPTTENNTANYLDFVCRNARGCAYIQPDVPFTDLHQFLFFCLRMVKYENGFNAFQMENYGFTYQRFEKIISKYDLNYDNVL